MNFDIEKYSYVVHWSEEDDEFVGTCLEFPSLSGFGSTPGDALNEIADVVRASVSILEEDGQDIPAPLGSRSYRGNLSLRIPPETHKLVALSAAMEGISINQYITSSIERAVGLSHVQPVLRQLTESLEHISQVAAYGLGPMLASLWYEGELQDTYSGAVELKDRRQFRVISSGADANQPATA